MQHSLQSATIIFYLTWNSFKKFSVPSRTQRLVERWPPGWFPGLWAVIVSWPRVDPGGGRLGDFPPLKTYESNSFHHDFVPLKNSICDRKPSCSPLFCHSSVVECTSALLQ